MVIIQFADTTGAPDAGRGSTGPDMPLCPLLPRDSLVPKKKRLVPFVLLLQTVSLHTYKACTEFFFFLLRTQWHYVATIEGMLRGDLF